MKKIITIIIAVLIAGGIIGLCVGLGVHFGKNKKSEQVTVEQATADKDTFYLLDSKRDWQWSDNNKFTVDNSGEIPSNVIKQYVYTAFYEKDDEAKVWKGSDSWSFNHLEQSWDFCEFKENIRFTKSGTYRFYLKLYSDGGDSLYIEKKDETDAKDLYIDQLRFNPLRPYDETKLNEYDKFRLYVYSAPNYNGSGYHTPIFLDNPLKTGKPVVYSGEVGFRKENEGEVQSLPYTITLAANKMNDGIEITLNGSENVHIDEILHSPLGLIYKY